MIALIEINNLLKQHGKNIANYPGFPVLDPTKMPTYANHLLLEEMVYDCNNLKLEASQRIGCLNHMQRVIFEKVVQAIASNKGDYILCMATVGPQRPIYGQPLYQN